MEFENGISRPGKVIDFWKNGRGHCKVLESQFLVQIFCAVRKLETFSLSLNENEPSQKAKFQQFLVMENLNWSLKSH